jgi:hypothetical protein
MPLLFWTLQTPQRMRGNTLNDALGQRQIGKERRHLRWPTNSQLCGQQYAEQPVEANTLAHVSLQGVLPLDGTAVLSTARAGTHHRPTQATRNLELRLSLRARQVAQLVICNQRKACHLLQPRRHALQQVRLKAKAGETRID